MKIIRISTVPTSLYTFARSQFINLREEYEIVAVSSPEKELRQIQDECAIRVVSVPMERHISIFKDILSLIRMIILFIKEKPDMVHSITPKAGLISMLAAWVTRVPVRMHTFTGLVFPTSKGAKRWILMLMDRIMCFCATYINPEGYGVANDLRRFGITKKEVHVIANGNVRGVDMNHYCRSTEVMIKAEELRREGIFTFCFVGRIVGDKGINELVAAFDILHAEISETRLLLIGQYEENLDPLLPQTKKRIEDGNGIEYVGQQNDVRPWMAASDAFVFPSYREGMPNCVLEAGAMELPSIVTDINGSNEIIYDGFNGVIVPSKDAEALYQRMKEWVQNPSLLQKMSAQAREIVESKYNQELIHRETLAVYRELLS